MLCWVKFLTLEKYLLSIFVLEFGCFLCYNILSVIVQVLLSLKQDGVVWQVYEIYIYPTYIHFIDFASRMRIYFPNIIDY